MLNSHNLLWFSLTIALTGSNSQRCSKYIDYLDKCLDRVQTSSNFLKLRNQETAIIDGCLKNKPDCPIGDSRKCQEAAKKDTATVLPAKQLMFTEIDACFANGQIDVFAALKSMGDSGTKWGRGGGKQQSNVGIRTKEDNPSDVSADPTAVPFDPNLVPIPTPTTDPASNYPQPNAPDPCPNTGVTDLGGLGGSTIDNSASNLINPTDFFASIFNPQGTAGGTGASSGPINPLAWFATLFNQGRKKRQANQQDIKKYAEACKPVMDCIENAHKTYSLQSHLISAAKGVYDQKQKCQSDNNSNPPFECTPTTKEQKKCVAAARKKFQQVMKTFMTSCHL